MTTGNTGFTQPSPSAPFDIERFVPLPVIQSIVNDWFELIYSVCPILHRSTFLKRLSEGEASLDPDFAALVLSICAATIASLRRKRIFEYDCEHGNVSPERCVQLAEDAGFFNGRRTITLERCQTFYNFSVAMGAKGIDDPESFMYMSEASSGIKWLAYYNLRTMTSIDQELLKRTFWICFAGVCTSDLHGRPSLGLLTSQDSIALFTPAEINDAELDPTGKDPLEAWHGDKMSYIPGLNFLSKLFLLWYRSQQNNDTIAHLQHHTNLVRCALDWMPPELQWRGGLSRTRGNFGTDVQTANLYITQLHIRYNLLEQMKALSKHDNNGGDTRMTLPEIVDERQSIVDDMLEILTHMPQSVLESNGFSLLPKIRDIGSSLLEDHRVGEWQNIGTPGAQRNLERLLLILRELDPAEPLHV